MIERAAPAAWIIGGLALLLAMLGWWLEPAMFPHAWLAALIAWIGWPLGSLALLLVHVLTGGRWGEAIQTYLLAGIATLALLMPGLLPFLFVLPQLYLWLHADIAKDLPNTFYLNLPFAAGRGVFYMIVWLALGALTLRAVRRDTLAAPLAVIGLILLGLTVTFAAIDATMSLEPQFISSDFGMIAAAEGGLLALAVTVLAASMDPLMPREILDDLGKLLLGLLVLWAYLEFMQLLIVWQSDLPHEAPWYIERSKAGWGTLAAILAFGHFGLPFFALISPTLRRSPIGIGGIAALLIVMQVLRAWWLVLPAAHRGIGWVDVAAMLAVIGLATGIALQLPHVLIARPRVGHG